MRQAVEILVFTQLRTKRNTSKYVFPNDTYASVYVEMKTPNDVYTPICVNKDERSKQLVTRSICTINAG